MFQLRKYKLLYIHQIGIIKTAAATISISVLYILYIFSPPQLQFPQKIFLNFSDIILTKKRNEQVDVFLSCFLRYNDESIKNNKNP